MIPLKITKTVNRYVERWNQVLRSKRFIRNTRKKYTNKTNIQTINLNKEKISISLVEEEYQTEPQAYVPTERQASALKALVQTISLHQHISIRQKSLDIDKLLNTQKKLKHLLFVYLTLYHCKNYDEFQKTLQLM